jgi:chromosome partitioning protein
MSENTSPDQSGSTPQSMNGIQPGTMVQEQSPSSENRPANQNEMDRGAYVIAIATQKGGVAKTTTAASLGGAMVQFGLRVLLIDLDAQANLTLAMGKDPYKVHGTITDVLFNTEHLFWKRHATSVAGLDLVPANSEMELAEHFLKQRNNYETILRNSINQSVRRLPLTRIEIGQVKKPKTSKTSSSTENPPVNQQIIPRFELSQLGEFQQTTSYDVVILDCPPSTGAVTINALVAADLLIIPIQPEYFSVHSLKAMLPTVREVRDKFNSNLAYRILITLFDRRNRIHRDFSKQLRQTCGSGVFRTIIEIDTKLRESALDGLPITELWKQSRSAVQYRALAEELIQLVPQSK